MNIIEAARAMQEGKKVRRSCWGKKTYIYFADDYRSVSLHTVDGDEKSFEMMGSYLLADDWEVVEC